MLRLFALIVWSTSILGVPAIATSAPVHAVALQPFEAHYEVWLDGRRQGESSIRLQRLNDGRWRHSVTATGTAGVARLAGIEAQQVSEFRLVDARPRIESALMRSEATFRSREVRAVFDWESGQAHWNGDVRSGRRGPLPLQTGATNAPLLNLLLALDVAEAPQGSQLDYPLFERGRVRQQHYQVGAREVVETPAGRFDAVPASHRRARDQRITTVWFAAGLPPTPVRMLRTEGGEARYELRLTRVTAD